MQILAGRGLVGGDRRDRPGTGRGVLPLPIAALKAGSAVLSNPANRHRAVALTFEQFRYGFGNAVSEEEAQELYEKFHVAGSGVPVFQAAFANINPRSELKADNRTPERGPLLVVAGELDHQAPHAIAKATYKRQTRTGRHGVPRDRRSGALADHRRRLARGGAGVARLRLALREVALVSPPPRARHLEADPASSPPASGTRSTGACPRCAGRGTGLPRSPGCSAR